jgi:hypothetical protein
MSRVLSAAPPKPCLSRARAMLASLLALALLGCTTTRAMTVITPASVRAELRVGDWVQLTTLSGQEWQLRLTAIGEHQLWGVDPDGARQVFALSDIRELEVRRDSLANMVFVTLGGMAVIVIATGMLAAIAFIALFGQSN